MIFFPKPISGTSEGEPILVVGLNENELIVVTPDGFLSTMPFPDVQLDWRYDQTLGAWIDISLGEDDDEPDQETSDDGSAPVPGDFPDLD